MVESVLKPLLIFELAKELQKVLKLSKTANVIALKNMLEINFNVLKLKNFKYITKNTSCLKKKKEKIKISLI